MNIRGFTWISILLGALASNLVASPAMALSCLSYLGANPTTAQSSSIVAADFSGDGREDLATGTGVHINQGDGVLGVEIAYPGGAIFERVVAADFNGDGLVDIVGHTSADVQVMRNQGGAQFGTPVTILAVPLIGRYYGLLVADMNGDQLPDIVAGRDNWQDAFYCSKYCHYPPDHCCDNADWRYFFDTVHTLINRGDGTFSGTEYAVFAWRLADADQYLVPKGLVAADFDADGFVDLAVGDSVWWDIGIYRNRGYGNFMPYSGISTPCFETFAVGDVDGDGVPDIVDCWVRLNPGNGIFGAATQQGLSQNTTALVDLSGDGMPDLVQLGNLLSVRRNLGGGQFGKTANYSTGGLEALGIASADFNSDGKLDLAVMNGFGFGSSLRNVGILLNQCLP